LCERLGDNFKLIEVLVALALLNFNRRNYRLARELAEKAVSRGQLANAPTSVAAANVVLGFVDFSVGPFPAAREDFERAVQLFAGTSSPHHFVFLAHYAPKVLVGVLVMLGYPSTALSRVEQLMLSAQSNSDVYSIAEALDTDCMCRVMLRDGRMVAQRAEELLSFAAEYQMPLISVSGRFFRGWAMAAAGQAEYGIAEMRPSVSDPTIAEGSFPALLLTLLAEACLKSGRVEEGLDLVARGLATAEQSGLRIAEAELYRLKGELFLVKDSRNQKEGERCLCKAVDIARWQGSRLFELRATISLARLLRDTSRRDEAHTKLAEIYGWFTEGLDTPDLREAKALLDQLAT
jgi:adenylate cyclase